MWSGSARRTSAARRAHRAREAGPILPAIASVLAASSTEPVGPSGWPLRSWIGLLLYLGLFVLALWGISRLASTTPTGEDGEGDA